MIFIQNKKKNFKIVWAYDPTISAHCANSILAYAYRARGEYINAMPSLSGKCGCERFISRLKLSYETNGYERAKCLLMIYINTKIFIVNICIQQFRNSLSDPDSSTPTGATYRFYPLGDRIAVDQSHVMES